MLSLSLFKPCILSESLHLRCVLSGWQLRCMLYRCNLSRCVLLCGVLFVLLLCFAFFRSSLFALTLLCFVPIRCELHCVWLSVSCIRSFALRLTLVLVHYTTSHYISLPWMPFCCVSQCFVFISTVGVVQYVLDGDTNWHPCCAVDGRRK